MTPDENVENYITLWGDCEHCGEHVPADQLEHVFGAGVCCDGCNPGPVEAILGEAVAATKDGKFGLWPAGRRSCAECEADVVTLSVMGEGEWLDDGPVWHGICIPCFSRTRLVPALERLAVVDS